SYRDRAISLARSIHRAFVVPGSGVFWKMTDDLSSPYPGSGFGKIDALNGYAVYRLLDENELAGEIADMRALVDARRVAVNLDLGLGVILWLTHFFARETWAELYCKAALRTLDKMWLSHHGCFCRTPASRDSRVAFANYGISLGLQAADRWPDRVASIHIVFKNPAADDPAANDAITHVMACVSHFPGEFLMQRTIAGHNRSVGEIICRRPLGRDHSNSTCAARGYAERARNDV